MYPLIIVSFKSLCILLYHLSHSYRSFLIITTLSQAMCFIGLEPNNGSYKTSSNFQSSFQVPIHTSEDVTPHKFLRLYFETQNTKLVKLNIFQQNDSSNESLLVPTTFWVSPSKDLDQSPKDQKFPLVAMTLRDESSLVLISHYFDISEKNPRYQYLD